ncbi:hypothetical protein JG688_00008273 [Phytophthora aleatoria]|uniref:Uncharacterized protein n=1 Tax=Phytophthora aleatoria TaxID=2496075 RepID=A0A8J5IIP9_9STRA|nr:hypothetical protein JG688_00008273 [Phytophthora aleatoria]
MIPDNDAVESVYTPSDDEHDNDDDDASGGLGSELPADSGDSLNSVADGDAAPQFGSMDCGDEAEKDDVEIGEYSSDEDPEGYCVPEDVVDDPDPTGQEVAAEVLFVEGFQSRFGGEDEVLAGNLKSDVLREMSAT